MHKLYSPSTGMLVDFSLRVPRAEQFATKFESYDEAHDAALVMDAHGWTDVRIVDGNWSPPPPPHATYAELQDALWQAVR